MSEIYEKNGEGKNHGCKTHRKRFSESKPLRKKGKYPVKIVTKKEKSENSKKGEMKTHVVVENKWIKDDKTDCNGNKKGKCSHFLSGEEDDIGDKTKNTCSENGYLRTNKNGKESNAKKC